MTRLARVIVVVMWLCVVVGVAAAARAQTPGHASSLAFVDVAVIPMDTERVLPHQTVVVRGTQIVALGPAATTPVPANAVRIAGAGKYLLPGLADMHVHVGTERELFDYVAEGVTTVRNMSHGTFMDAPSYANGLFDSLRHWRGRAAAGAIWSPRLYIAGRWYTDPKRSIAQNVAAYKAAGFDFIKLHNDDACLSMKLGICTDSQQVRRWRVQGLVGTDSVSAVAGIDSLVAAAQRVGLPIVGHPVISLAYALDHHFASIEHFYYFFDLAHNAHEDPNDYTLADTLGIPAAVAAFRRSGSWACPTLVLYRDTESFRAYYKAGLKLIKALHDAGVGLLTGTDEPADTTPGRTVHEELQALVEAGLSPYDALLASTRNVATFFQIQDSVGTVAIGKRADLLLLDANPLTDIRHTRDLAGVMVGGRWLAREDIARQRGTYTKAVGR